MKYQEALEIIKDELPFTSGVIEEALGLVEKCVNKQTLKKVILGYDEQDYVCCPQCKSEIAAKEDCEVELPEEGLDLINRQKAENKELRFDKIIAERHEKDARDLFVDCTRQLEEAKAEIERLKRGVTFTFTIEDFESIKETVISSLDNKIKSEAIKEFAERLKEKCYEDFQETYEMLSPYVTDDDIDNLVKEMTEVQE